VASDIKVVFEADTAPIDRAVRLLDNLEAELRDVQRAEKQGLITKKRLSQETARLNSNIDKLKTLSRGSAKDFRRFEKSLYGSGKAARANEVALQQAGYQVQDFIVQIQSGTNPLIAFSQQGSQLAGFFAGPWGAAIGLGIAAVGFLGTALLGLGEKSDKIKKQMENLNETLSLYSDLSSQISDSKALSEEFGNLANQARSMLEALQQIQGITLSKQISEFGGLGEIIRNISYESDKNGFLGLGVKKVQRLDPSQIDAASEFLGVSDKSVAESSRYAGEYLRLLEGLQKAKGLKEQAAAAGELSKFLKEHVNSYELSEEATNAISAVQERLLQITKLQGQEQQKSASKLQQIQTDAMAMEAEIAQEQLDNIKRNYTFAGRLMQEAATEQAAIDAGRQSRIEANYQISGRLMTQAAQEEQDAQNQLYTNSMLAIQNAMAQEITKAKEQKKLADETHAYMMALQNAYYADAKKQAGEVASATYMANYKAVLAYQAYGESRMAAPEDPVKPKKTPKGPKASTIEDTIKQLQRQADKDKQLVRLTGQKRREEELFIDLKNANADADIKTSETRLRTIAQEISAMEERNRVIEAARQQQEALKGTIESSMEDAFMSIVDGTKTVEQAFKDMARQIIAELYRVLVVKKMVAAISSVLPFANGGVFQGGSQVKAFASGGVVGGPTYFPMSGGKTGLMGEAGPEAIMPLKRGKDGKLGVAAEGGGGVTINQTFAFQANGDDSVKKIIAQAAPKIAAMTQQQIMDSRRRGGQMKQVFG